MSDNGKRRGPRKLPVEPVDASAFDGDTVAGEVLDDEPPQDTGRARSDGDEAGTSASDRARTFFGGVGSFADHRARRERRHERNQARIQDKAARGEATERDWLLGLRDDIRTAGERYMASLRKSGIMVPGFTDDERVAKVDDLHKTYTMMMAFACLRPLKAGVSAQSVVQAAGMMSAMYMLSGDFRSQVAEYRDKVHDQIASRIDVRAHRELEKAGGDRSRLSQRWQQRLDDIEYRQRGHRRPYTAQSAGMTQVALAEAAFEQMRQPGADAATIVKSHHAMLEHLHRQAADDGLTKAEVARAARVVLGQRLEAEPELAVMFDGLAHGEHRKSPAREVRLGETGTVQKVWTGEFEDASGTPVTAETMFGPREPMGADAHQARIAQTMTQRLHHAAQLGDLDAFSASMTAYLMGPVAQEEGTDLSGAVDPVRTPLAQAETMLASMVADGLGPEERERVYGNACTDALESVQSEYPGLAQAWSRRYGADWHRFMDEVRQNPEEAFTHWHGANTRNAGPHGPESGQDRTYGGDQDRSDEGDFDFQPS